MSMKIKIEATNPKRKGAVISASKIDYLIEWLNKDDAIPYWFTVVK